MIINGAQQGIAGFGLASDPNLSALLYNASQPVGSRISILNSTTIPRVYHSEATLLPDGRVLISGSDPQTSGLNEELRIEVYIPPYLNQGLTQPTVMVSKTDWSYGGQFQIKVHLSQGAEYDSEQHFGPFRPLINRRLAALHGVGKCYWWYQKSGDNSSLKAGRHAANKSLKNQQTCLWPVKGSELGLGVRIEMVMGAGNDLDQELRDP